MGFIELFLIGVSLSMDAFAVAVAKGLSMRRINYRHACVIALFFGGFQALMPFVGWAIGSRLAGFVEPIDHWIAFFLIAIIGAKMLVDALRSDADSEKGQGPDTSSLDWPDPRSDGLPPAQPSACSGDSPASQPLDLKELLVLAVATSIDALAVGVSFAFLQVSIVFAICVIGFTTFAISFVGVCVGNLFGSRWEKPSSVAGGIVLIAIGLKILIEHLAG